MAIIRSCNKTFALQVIKHHIETSHSSFKTANTDYGVKVNLFTGYKTIKLSFENYINIISNFQTKIC